MALTDNLISYWKLDEASGNAADAHGSNTLTDNNTVTNGTGLVYGTARQFAAASDESFSLADNASLSTGDIDFTFAAWVNAADLSTYRTILNKDNGSAWEYQLYYATGPDRFQWYVESAGGAGDVNADVLGSPSINTWYFIVAWHDATANTINIQVNDGTVDSEAYTFGVRDGSGAFYLGRETTANASDMEGRIGPVMFWKRVLTAGERTSLYNSGAGLAYASFGGGATAVPVFMNQYRQRWA